MRIAASNSLSLVSAETQPALKSRGVSYWQEKNPQAGVACQKMVYLGNMTAQLYAVDADTGKPCENFGKNGVVDVNQWNKQNNKWPLSQLQPPTVIGDKLIVGWAGKDWEYEVESPGSLFALNARTGELEWEFKPIPEEEAGKTGTANIWTAMSYDPALGLLYIPVLVVGLMAYFPDTRIALYVGPVFLVLLTVLFYVFKLQPTKAGLGAACSQQ